MAYVDNGRWLTYDERAEYLAGLREERRLIMALVNAGSAVASDIDRLEFILPEIERVEAIHRGEHDVLFFGMHYFSEDGNPDNHDNLIPAGVNVENAAEFHAILCDMFRGVITGDVEDHVAWACPRGHAKTAWISNIFLCHQVVYRHRKYIVEVSETTDSAGDFITWTRYQLKLNQKLRADFGELLEVRPSMNELDNRYEFITSSGTKVEAKGLGTQMRGLRYGASRPDLFILDDLESKDSTNTPELIEKSKRWFREEMLHALSKGGICIYLGTILCYGSLLDYVIRERKDFKSRRFAAVKSFANNTALWDKWREIRRQDVEDAAQLAKTFYAENEDAMLDGVEILWPGYWSYYELMVKLEEDGVKAFAQEFQNEPTDEERQVFKEEELYFFREDDVMNETLTFYAAIDVAMGKAKGDYTVIATGAKNEKTGTLYVWDLLVQRIHPDELIRQATAQALQYQYALIGVEAVFAQEFIADSLYRSLEAAGYPASTRLRYLRSKTNKQIRIESMQPALQAGRVRFNEKLRNRLEQLYMYPMHKHDDVPDAIEMLIRTAESGGGTVRVTKDAAGRWRR